jgi:hypothetical protein
MTNAHKVLTLSRFHSTFENFMRRPGAEHSCQPCHANHVDHFDHVNPANTLKNSKPGIFNQLVEAYVHRKLTMHFILLVLLCSSVWSTTEP